MGKKRGLVFIENRKPSKEDKFLYRRLYRFVPDFIKRDTHIFIDIYACNIAVISFYDKLTSHNPNKFKSRFNYSPGHVKAIFKACLEAFYLQEEYPYQYALVFNATNDIGKKEELNARYSAYTLFLKYYFKDYKEYEQKGSLGLNTLMLYHASFPNKKLADMFFAEFEKEVAEESELEDNVDENK